MKSSEKKAEKIGLLKRISNKLKHWYSKVKLFFICTVAHRTNPTLSKAEIIMEQLHKKSLTAERDLKFLNYQFSEYQRKYPYASAFLIHLKKDNNNKREYWITCSFDAGGVTL